MVYERIYRKLIALLPGIETMRAGDALTLKAPGFMDLHVDVLLHEPHGSGAVTMPSIVIALAHRWRHPSGDSMADPDMEIRIIPSMKMAEALTFKQDGFPGVGTLYQEVYPAPGRVRPTLKKQLNRFLDQWLSNLRAQGHKLPDRSAA